MRILDRYIGSSFLRGFLLVLCILVSLITFAELVGQLDNVGKRNYQTYDALIVVALTMPRRIYDLVPISAMLGSIIALGVLADRGELLAMRAAGVSVYRVCLSVLVTGSLLMLTAAALGEFIAPPLEQSARTLRSRALADPKILVTQKGFWARRGHSFIHVERVLQGGKVADVDIYERDKEGRLMTFIHARKANILNDRRWLLQDIDKKTVLNAEISSQQLPSLTLDSFLSSEQVAVLELPPDTLSGADLYRYIKTLRERGQNVDSYVLALWQKVTIPLAIGAMILLSLTFVFGPPRERTAGFRITMGAIVGVAFYLANQVMGRMGLVMDIHPALTTLPPVAVTFAAALWLLRRIP